MNIPTFHNSRVVDKDGNFTSEWLSIMQILFSQLKSNFSREGIRVPQQPTSTINDPNVLNNIASKGVVIYDETTNELKVNINGTFKVIQVI